MAVEFDPYHKWLGIPPRYQPPNYYRLLGVEEFEDDYDVIAHAADQRMIHVKSFQAGQYSKLSQKLLNEIAMARTNLLDPANKTAYDQQLRIQQRQSAPPPRQKATPAASNPPPVLDSSSQATDDGASTIDINARTSGAARKITTALRRGKSRQKDTVQIVGGILILIVAVGIGIVVIRSSLYQRTDSPAPPKPSDGEPFAKKPKDNGETPTVADPAATEPKFKESNKNDSKSVSPVEAGPTEKASSVAKQQPVAKPEPPPLTPNQRLDRAMAAANIKEVFDLFDTHTELHGSDIVEKKLTALENLQNKIDTSESATSRFAAQAAIDLLELEGTSRPKEFAARCIAVVRVCAPNAKDSELQQQIQNQLTTLKNHFVARRDLEFGLVLAIELSELQRENKNKQDVTLEFLEQLGDQPEDVQRSRAAAEFSAAFLQDGTNCDEKEFLTKCSKFAISAARKHYNKTGNNEALNRVTLLIVEFHERCD